MPAPSIESAPTRSPSRLAGEARGPQRRASFEKGETRRGWNARGYRGPAASLRRWPEGVTPARLGRALLEGTLLVALFVCILFAGGVIADAVLATRGLAV